VEEFAKLMSERNVDLRFKKLIMDIRQRYQRHDYSMCTMHGELLLPFDLGAMISYLDKRYRILKIRNSIKAKELNDVDGKTEL